MNDRILQDFQAQVDRAVHPVIASPRRTRIMQEELLDHLLETFNEEFARSNDEQSARDAALRRFGDPVEVSARLQASVSKFERALFTFLSGKETPMTRTLWVIGILAIIVGQNMFAVVGEQILFARVALIAILCARHLLQKEGVASRYLGSHGHWLAGAFGFFFGMAVILPALAKIKQNRIADITNVPHQYITTLNIEALTVGLLITLLGRFIFIRHFLSRRPQTS
jgi:hypothetical protein